MVERLSGPMLAPVNGVAKSIVVLLHGYGSDGRDLISLGQFWRDSFPDTLFVAPNAPEVCEMNPSGFQWFPLEGDKAVNRIVGAKSAQPIIEQFLEDVWAQTGLSAQDTVLAGFSQGAMMSLYAGLRMKEELKAIIAFSGMMIAPDALGEELASKPTVLLIHGDEDSVVPVDGSTALLPILLEHGIDARLHIEEGSGHTIAQDGLDAATALLAEKLRS